MNYTAIIVDDEPHAVRTLTAQLEWTHLPVSVIATAHSVQEAHETLRKQKPDFLFLDIKMPGSTGFDLFPSIDSAVTDIIFTTAHDEFALKAFQHQAAGYLMKPVSTIELKSLLQKLINKRGLSAADNQDLILEEKGGMLKIPLHQIMYIYSEGSISVIKKSDGTQRTVNALLKELEAKLAQSGFFRVHNQYLVNLSKVTEVIKARNAELVLDNAQKLPVSRAKKMAFYEHFA